MLKGKRILIIGGTTGIGAAATSYFLKNGARVVATGKSVQDSELKPSKNLQLLQGDIQKEKELIHTIKEAREVLGEINGLYHVAGGSGRAFGDGPLDTLSLEAWNKTFNLNLTSIFISNREVLNIFLEQKDGGSILNVGSVLAFSPSPRHFVTHAYAAAKSALVGYTKSTAAYYASKNIRINAICPGLVRTPMAQRAFQNPEIQSFIKTKQPLDGGRFGTPEDYCGAAAFFLSDLSKFTTGQILGIDGGWEVSEGQYKP